MKVLLINKFLFPKGGDAISTRNTGKLLSSKGHEVIYWGMKHPNNPPYPYKNLFVNNIDFNIRKSFKESFLNSLNVLYSFEAKSKIERLIKKERPDIAHLNNFAHQISPSILHVFKKYKIPVVMTMRDYKLACPTYSMLLNGRPCEKCKNGAYFHCLLNKCTKNSYAKSFLNTAEMYLHHKIMHIYDLIDVFISPSMFLKNKLEEMGFKGKIVHLPNFVDLEEYEPKYDWDERSIVYFGRLSVEKGVNTLIEAMRGIDITLKIIGDGPEGERLKDKVKRLSLNNVKFLGYMTGNALKDEIRKSMFVVLPSECYENNPRSIIEGFALGKAAIGSKIGGIPELIKDGETGYTFEPGNICALHSKISLLTNNDNKIGGMGRNARTFTASKHNKIVHFEKIIRIYTTIKK